MSRSMKGKAFSCPDGDDHVVGRENDLLRSGPAGGRTLELHADELSALQHEAERHVVDQDVDLLLLGVLQLPGRSLEVLAVAAGHHLDVLAAQAPRRPAAVHRRVADADDEDALADRADVIEGDALQPVDPDVDPRRRFLAPRQIQILAARRARADEDGVEPRPEQRLEALHRRAVPNLHPHVDDHGDLFVEHRGRQTEAGDVGPHEPARPGVLLEHHDLVAERHQIVGHRQRRGSRADTGDALPVLRRGRLRQSRADVSLEIGGHALDAADGDRLLLDAHAAAGRLARAIAGAPEDPREDVGVAVEQIGVVVAPLRDHADVLRHVGVRRAGHWQSTTL